MQFEREILKGAADVVVLKILNDMGESYGYELAQAIKNQSKEIFDFPEGTLYPLLYRLEDKDLVSSREKTMNHKTRRYYRLTREGLKHLQRKTAQWEMFMQGLKTVLKTTL